MFSQGQQPSTITGRQEDLPCSWVSCPLLLRLLLIMLSQGYQQALPAGDQRLLLPAGQGGASLLLLMLLFLLYLQTAANICAATRLSAFMAMLYASMQMLTAHTARVIAPSSPLNDMPSIPISFMPLSGHSQHIDPMISSLSY